MKLFFSLGIITLLNIIPFLSFSQKDSIKLGCKYIHSKYKNTGFTPEELSYASSLTFRSDTFDIVNYHITLDVTNFSSKTIRGKCTIEFSPKMDSLHYIIFDLLEMNIDSVKFNDSNPDYTYKSPFLKIEFDTTLSVNDTLQTTVFYHGKSVIDPSGFGGFYFDKGVAYNLGIGLSSIPHNYGRSWFPCFDNFVERSTYDFDIITKPDHVAYCTGIYLGLDTLPDKKKMYHYRMEKQIPTYLAGVAASNYKEINWHFQGMERNIPIQIVAQPQDTSHVKTSFAYLPFAIEAMEYWYGPYDWSRVGYVLTSHGAMEHPTNIAFNDFLGNDGKPEVAMGVMAHELAHQWWGDITTLTTAHDMWIKEGTAEYGRHLFMEYFFGKKTFIDVLKNNQLEVITTAHKDDDGYLALSGMPLNHTYGTTTYNKGAAVFHNLRTYLGDSLYRIGMQSILKEYAYSHLDADQFQKQLEKSTGKDLSCFFDNWIYSPGFCAFEIDSIHTQKQADNFLINIFIEQKIHKAPDYYCDVPVEITFYDKEFNKIDKTIIESGKYDSTKILLPFNPVFWTINEEQHLNCGQIGEKVHLKENQTYNLKKSKISFKTTDLDTDSIFVYSEHIWGKPDEAKNTNPDLKLKISNSHFWNVTGELPDSNSIKASFFYNGSNNLELDYDLAHYSEDSILIVYRKNAYMDWEIVENFKKQKFSPIDGKGTITITGLKPGQYAFANIIQQTNSVAKVNYNQFFIYPNPVKDLLYINTPDKNALKILRIYSALGEKIYNDILPQFNTVDLSFLDTGIYFIKIINRKAENVYSGKIIKL